MFCVTTAGAGEDAAGQVGTGGRAGATMETDASAKATAAATTTAAHAGPESARYEWW